MKRVVRNHLFETNSSSVHTFSFAVDDIENNLVVGEDGYVHCELGEFGWEEETYSTPSDKLNYILLAAAHYTGHSYWYSGDFEETWNSFKRTELFEKIENAVRSNVSDCEGVRLDEDSQGYIDHQSLEQPSFYDWLSDTGADSIEDFIFGKIVIHTDNDNQ